MTKEGLLLWRETVKEVDSSCTINDDMRIDHKIYEDENSMLYQISYSGREPISIKSYKEKGIITFYEPVPVIKKVTKHEVIVTRYEPKSKLQPYDIVEIQDWNRREVKDKPNPDIKPPKYDVVTEGYNPWSVDADLYYMHSKPGHFQWGDYLREILECSIADNGNTPLTLEPIVNMIDRKMIEDSRDDL